MFLYGIRNLSYTLSKNKRRNDSLGLSEKWTIIFQDGGVTFCYAKVGRVTLSHHTRPVLMVFL